MSYSVVILSREWSARLHRCLESVLAQTSPPLETILIDNSEDGSLTSRVQELLSEVICIPQFRNRFFAAGANTGIIASRGDWILLLNDDAYLDRNWADAILSAEISDDVGSIASVVWRASRPGYIDSMGDHFDLSGRAGAIGWNERIDALPESPYEVFSASAACALYRRSALSKAGAFDEKFVAYLEDVDLGFRLRLLGFRCILLPSAHAWHEGGATPKTRHRALFLTERNAVWTIWKNMPASLLRTHFARLVVSQSRPAPVVGGGTFWAWAQGKAAALVTPALVADRKAVQSSAVAAPSSIERILSTHALSVCHL